MATVYSGTNRQIAIMAGKSSVMDEAAKKVLAKAKANAAQHHRTGQYSDNFDVAAVKARKTSVRDRVVYNNHNAALIIEFGHFVEKEDGSLGDYIPGQFNLVRAVK